jgi:hypothetical protein
MVSEEIIKDEGLEEMEQEEPSKVAEHSEVVVEAEVVIEGSEDVKIEAEPVPVQ